MTIRALDSKLSVSKSKDGKEGHKLRCLQPKCRKLNCHRPTCRPIVTWSMKILNPISSIKILNKEPDFSSLKPIIWLTAADVTGATKSALKCLVERLTYSILCTVDQHSQSKQYAQQQIRTTLLKGTLKGEVSLYSWPTVWLV